MNTKRAERLASLEWEVEQIIAAARAFEKRYKVQLDQLHPEQARSGRNLLHYLALRRRSMEKAQAELAGQGLSSLGRSESSVLSSLYAVHFALRSLQGSPGKRRKGPVTLSQGRKLLKAHTRALLGKKLKGSATRIMVTLPVEAADRPELVRSLLEAGMNCARINCAQGGPTEWGRMVDHVRRAQKATGRACKIYMDVSGPKIRTGAMVPGPRIRALRPPKNERGLVMSPLPVWLVPEPGPDEEPAVPNPERTEIPVDAELFSQLHVGDHLTFRDTRGKDGTLNVVEVEADGAQALCPTTLYVESGMTLVLHFADGAPDVTGVVGSLPSVDAPIVLQVGDTLVIHKDPRPGEPAAPATEDGPARPAHVSCTLPQVLDDVRVGEPLVLDDGKAAGVIRSVADGEVVVEITRSREGGMKLRANKGINVPESRLHIAGLTDQDKEDLRFVAAHADGVNVSFVNHPDDVEDLLDELEAVGGEHLGLILKIETQQGFQNLPGILLAAMEWPLVGVMIARGDLAVEAGWTHLARIQEEILCVCEAAHTPVVWATEVLDRMAKKGMPTRSEITDAAMAERAECVMLNKGPYILEAIRTLDEVLRSIQAYQRKKTSLLPALTLDDPDPAEVGRAVGLRLGRWQD